MVQAASQCEKQLKLLWVQTSKSSPPVQGSSTDSSSKGQYKPLLQKGRTVEVGRYLWRSFSPTSPAQKAGLTKWVAQDLVWVSPRMETPWFPWTICPVLNQYSNSFPLFCFNTVSCMSLCDCCLLSVHWTPLKEPACLPYIVPADISTHP